MTDLESRVRATLAERAERTEAPAGLGERAARRGRIVRRRRVAIGTAAAVFALVGAFVAFPRLAPGTADTSLPVETGAPSGGVGVDRRLLHFDVDLTRLPVALRSRIAMTEWVSGEGFERFAGLDADRHTVVTVRLGTEPPGGWVPGKDAVATRPFERDGITGVTMVNQADSAQLPAIDPAVRLGVVQRCVLPLNLSAVPEGARWSECLTRFRRDRAGLRWADGGLTIQRADGHAVFIWADGESTDHSSFEPDRTAGGRPAQWLHQGAKNGLWIPEFGGYELFVTNYETKPADWFTLELADWYAARLQPSTNLGDPSSWPHSPVGA